MSSPLRLEITDIGAHGEGVGRAGDLVVFTPGLLPGDVAEIALTEQKKTYARGHALRILTPSPDRVAPPCPLVERCGGCQLQGLSYAAQLTWKKRHVADAMARIGGLRCNVAEVLPSPPLQYRTKTARPVGGRSGDLQFGFYAPFSHELIDAPHCLVEAPLLGSGLQAVRAACNETGIAPYRKGGTGLRYVVGRAALATSQLLVTLVFGRLPPRSILDRLVQAVTTRLPTLTSLYACENSAAGNAVFGRRFRHLHGAREIEERLLGLRFGISPVSFFQVNPVMAARLGETVRELADAAGAHVLDAYCGTGSLALILAAQAKSVLGVEIVDEAVRDARRNAQRNAITNARFEAAAAELALREYAQKGRRFDVVVLDPPRKGCADVVEAVIKTQPGRIVYVSCNAATLARDAASLTAGGYRLRALQPLDLFPQTVHVETAACFEKA